MTTNNDMFSDHAIADAIEAYTAAYRDGHGVVDSMRAGIRAACAVLREVLESMRADREWAHTLLSDATVRAEAAEARLSSAETARDSYAHAIGQIEGALGYAGARPVGDTVDDVKRLAKRADWAERTAHDTADLMVRAGDELRAEVAAWTARAETAERELRRVFDASENRAREIGVLNKRLRDLEQSTRAPKSEVCVVSDGVGMDEHGGYQTIDGERHDMSVCEVVRVASERVRLAEVERDECRAEATKEAYSRALAEVERDQNKARYEAAERERDEARAVLAQLGTREAAGRVCQRYHESEDDASQWPQELRDTAYSDMHRALLAELGAPAAEPAPLPDDEARNLRGSAGLLKLLRQGGCIVSTAAVPPDAVTHARADGCVHVDADGFGYVWTPREPFAQTPQAEPAPVTRAEFAALCEALIDALKRAKGGVP